MKRSRACFDLTALSKPANEVDTASTRRPCLPFPRHLDVVSLASRLDALRFGHLQSAVSAPYLKRRKECSTDNESWARVDAMRHKYSRHLSAAQFFFAGELRRRQQHEVGHYSSPEPQLKIQTFLANIERISKFLAHKENDQEVPAASKLDRVEKHIQDIILPVLGEVIRVSANKNKRQRARPRPRQRQRSQVKCSSNAVPAEHSNGTYNFGFPIPPWKAMCALKTVHAATSVVLF